MSDHWHKHYHSRILNSYSKLPVDLRGVAYTLLDMIYDAGGPLADSDAILAAKMCCSLRMWKAYKTRLLELGKFQLTADGKLTNKLCQDELFKRRKQAEFGSAGGRKKAENQKTRNQFKGGDVGTLQGTLLANQKIEVREEPNGSSSEAKASGADAPFDLKKWVFTEIAGCFVSAGESEQHGRSMAGKLWSQHEEFAERVVTAMLADPPAKPSQWFGKVFKQLADKSKQAPAADTPPAREIVHDADGNPVGVRDLRTGEVKPIARAA